MSEPITIPYKFVPRDYQLKVFQALDGELGKPESKLKRVFLRWHRRAGKDKVCWNYLIKAAVETPGNYFYVWPTAAEGRKALWENIDSDGMRALDHIPKELVKNINNQEMLVRLHSGPDLSGESTIRLIGSDINPDAIRGVSTKGMVSTEFDYQEPGTYKVLMPALRQTGGWWIVNSTPQGRGQQYELEERIKNSPNWFVSILQTRWPDKPNYSGLLTPTELEEVQSEEGLTDDDMDREYGVSYTAGMKGAFYADHIEKARAENRIGNFVHDDHKYVDTFWDIGMGDDTAIWFRQIDGNRIVWIDYYQNSGKDYAHYVRKLKEKGYEYRTHYFPWDGGTVSQQTGLSAVEKVSDLLLEARMSDDVVAVPKLPVQDGINAVRSRFSRYHFDEGNCEHALKMLEMYHRKWDKRRNTFIKQPVHDWTSHCADALRTEGVAEELMEDEFYAQNNLNIINEYDIFGDDHGGSI
jgi:hypothetical protein